MRKKIIINLLSTPSHRSRDRWSTFTGISRDVRSTILAMAMLMGSVDTSWAADGDYENPTDTTRLAEVEVIAKRAYPARGIAMSRTVYSADDVTLQPVQTIEDAIKSDPGIDVRQRGGLAIQADVSLYGSNADQTTILLNGIDFTDPRTGHQSNSLPIDVECLSRITSVDGILGANTYAGGINYVTNFANRKFIRAGVTGGDFGYWRTFMTSGTATNDYTALMSVSYTTSDGYQANTDFNNINLFAYSTIKPKLGRYKLGEFEIQAGAQRRQFGSYGFYSLRYPWQWEQTETFLASARWNKNINQNISISSFAGYRRNKDLYELYRDGYERPDWYKGHNHHLTDNIVAGVQADYSFSHGTTAAGVDMTYNHIYSNVLGRDIDHPRRVHGYPNAFYTKQYDRFVMDYWMRQTLRIDDIIFINASANVVDSPYGTDLMWGITTDLRPIDNLDIYITGARTMRLPTFTDQFYTSADHVSNPDLRPEFAKNIRLSVAYRYRDFSARLSAYHRWGTNIIDWMKDDPMDPWRVEQYGKVNTIGATVNLAYNPGLFINRIEASYGYCNNSNDSDGHMSQYDMTFMRNKASVYLQLSITKTTDLGIRWSYFDRAGSFYNILGESEPYSAYTLLDARFTQQIGQFIVHIDINNILNKTYYDFGGLLMPKRWFMAGVSVTL